jgi:DHA3 family macrolide efflux protein-like MFS transporter
MGFKTLKLIPGLIIMLILAMILNFLIRPLDSLMPLYILNFHMGTAGHLAVAQMTFTGGLIAGAFFTSVKKTWNKKIRVIFIALVFAMVGYLIFALAPPGYYYIMALGGFVLGFNLPIVNALYQTFMQMAVPPEKLGRVSSIDHSLSSAISPIGSILSGPLALLLGIQGLYIYCSLIGILCTIGFWSFTSVRKADLDSERSLEEINGKIESLSN